MKTKTIELYEFDELSEEAKEKARDWYKENMDYYWWNEAKKSLDTFCSDLGIEVTNYSISPYEFSFVDTNCDNVYTEYDGYVPQFEDEYMPTGYYTDCVLYNTYMNLIRSSELQDVGEKITKAIDEALGEFVDTVKSDMEYFYSDESVDEHITINEYTFTVDGERMN